MDTHGNQAEPARETRYLIVLQIFDYRASFSFLYR